MFRTLKWRKGGEPKILHLIWQAPAQMPEIVGQVAFGGSIIILALVLWRFSKIE
jgi:hypothetical protein